VRGFILATSLLFISLTAHAGYVELGATANYKFSGFDKNNSIESISYTGSYAYYFFEQCAMELSYTSGYSKQIAKASVSDPKYVTEANIDLIALDLILSFGGKEATIQPYIKLGGGYLKKELFFRVDDGPNRRTSSSEGFVPSGGFGLKIGLTQTLSLKFGVDAWTSPLAREKGEPLIVDYVGRAGLSWMF
jgi:hypothetical protein